MTTPVAVLPTANYCAITPYLIPADAIKKVNIGDGFILDSATKLIGARPHLLLSSREPLAAAAIEQINTCRLVVAVGANTLKDDFELTPQFDMATLSQIKVPVILMGVGHYGVKEMTQGLSAESTQLFRALLERFPKISVRCDASKRYLTAALPEHEKNILMTSCPVVFPVDGIDAGFISKPIYEQLVVTITDRTLLQQQLPMLTAARQQIAARRYVLALHQDYGNSALWDYARKAGYEVFRNDDCRDFLALYAQTDIHFGNRLHAHLKCLSYGVTSFLAPFDLRQAYFSQSLDFPLITQLPSTEMAAYDFARMQIRRNIAKLAMDQFVGEIHLLLR